MDIEIYIKDELLRAYLPGLFNRDGTLFIASDKTLTGIAICTLVKTSDTMRRHVRSGQPGLVAFRLSKSDYNTNLLGRHLYLSPTAEAMINTVLRKEFEANFNAFCVDYQQSGLKLKEAIELFIVENKMDEFFQGDIDTLKKRAYRHHLSNIQHAKERLRQLAYNSRKRKLKT